MKLRKRILWALAALLALVLIFFLVFWKTAIRVSPPDTVSFNKNGLSLGIDYSRPFMKGRLIFGEESEGALQPYGKYWRAGANEATRITFGEDVMFGENTVSKGEYSLYAIPGKELWQIALNKQANRWGFNPPPVADDITRISVIPEKISPPREQFTISIKENPPGALIILEWSDVRVSVPVQAAQ